MREKTLQKLDELLVRYQASMEEPGEDAELDYDEQISMWSGLISSGRISELPGSYQMFAEKLLTEGRITG